MHKKQHTAIILFMIVRVLILLPGCSKKAPETGESDITAQEKDLAAQILREQLEKEGREREWRAEKVKFMHEDIYFDKGSYKLRADARDLLQRKAVWLQKNSDIKVIVEGHTDEAGTKEYNFALGDRRAGAVKSFLIGQGIQPSHLIAVSYGNEQPIGPRNTEKERSKNRRVHFVIED